ncbi:MAG: leucine-rich repeat protein [Muribaculaceae bacterium]|nr:leucine-rich repeat protein [Muribaculaceae bacterium]
MKNLLKLTLLLGLLFPAIASAHDFEVDGFYYNLNGNEVTLTYQGTSSSQYSNEYTGDVIIPGNVTYDGITYPVTTIGRDAFKSCKEVTSVVIPNSVKTIELCAFQYCSKLASVTVPNSLTTVYRYAFSNCIGLTKVNITDLASWCGIYFETSDANPLNNAHHLYLNGSEVKNLYIPSDVSSIGKYAFYGCSGLTSVYFPNTDGGLAIGDWAFSNCTGLYGVTISESVTSIGKSIFSNCTNMEYIEVDRYNPYYDSRDYSNAIIETASNILVMGCKYTTIPNTVQAIGYGAFSGLTDITHIDIPSSVASIGDYAFNRCSDLNDISFSEGLTNIGKSAFSNCTNIEEILFPNTLTSIDMFAFYQCEGLRNVYLGNSLTHIGDLAFIYCGALTSIQIPASVSFIGEFAFEECNSLTSIKVHPSNQYYDSRDNCNALIETSSNTLICGCQNTVIPNTVTAIESCAFTVCPGLTTINIPNGITRIGSEAFCFCDNLTEVYSYVTDPSAVDVGENAFYRYPNTYNGRTIHVPYATTAAYQADPDWGPYFANIVEMDSEPSTSIELDQTAAEVIEGATLTLKATVTPVNAANKPLAWTSSNPSVATVSDNGEVSAVCVGKTTITATTTDGTELSALCEVTVKSEISDNCFVISDIYAHPGDTVSIPVRMINSEPVTWFITDIYLPEGFIIPTHINEYNGYEDYDVFPSDRFTDDHYIITAMMNDGSVRVFGNNFSDLPFIGNDGVLFYITVIVPEVADDYYSIHLRNSELIFVDGFDRIPVAGAVIYTDFMSGDINGDGALTISDVTALIDQLLSGDDIPAYADVNGNGVVNISDVTALIDILLSGN